MTDKKKQSKGNSKGNGAGKFILGAAIGAAIGAIASKFIKFGEGNKKDEEDQDEYELEITAKAVTGEKKNTKKTDETVDKAKEQVKKVPEKTVADKKDGERKVANEKTVKTTASGK